MQHAFHLCLRAYQLRISGAHFDHQRRDQLVKKRFFKSELVAVANRTADNTAQHIAAPFVGGHYAIGY